MGPEPWEPTAHALVAEMAATPVSSSPDPTFGLARSFQEDPFQNSVKVLPGWTSACADGPNMSHVKTAIEDDSTDSTTIRNRRDRTMYPLPALPSTDS